MSAAVNKVSDSKRLGEFLEYLKTYYRLVTQAALFFTEVVNLQ